jgi:hypothetical protein
MLQGTLFILWSAFAVGVVFLCGRWLGFSVGLVGLVGTVWIGAGGFESFCMGPGGFFVGLGGLLSLGIVDLWLPWRSL